MRIAPAASSASAAASCARIALPVAALYAQGRVKHLGAMPRLEDEMVAFGPDGLAEGRSPDRLDALVWALTHLALDGEAGAPRIRQVNW